MYIPELLATEELEPKCRKHHKKFKYKLSTIRFNYYEVQINKGWVPIIDFLYNNINDKNLIWSFSDV